MTDKEFTAMRSKMDTAHRLRERISDLKKLSDEIRSGTDFTLGAAHLETKKFQVQVPGREMVLGMLASTIKSSEEEFANL